MNLPDKPPGMPWHKVDDLTARQVTAMDRLANAVRAAKVIEDEAAVIEQMIRDGHVPGALKRITLAGRRAAGD
ncbi:MAG: hypothetical protein GEV10_14010 [Streptosporangiales bacterium]|nr:hypothetical protein [Streptosporangiales bacterium]